MFFLGVIEASSLPLHKGLNFVKTISVSKSVVCGEADWETACFFVYVLCHGVVMTVQPLSTYRPEFCIYTMPAGNGIRVLVEKS